MEIDTREGSVFDRRGGGPGPAAYPNVNQVCRFWLAGTCYKNPCRFLHPGSPNTTNSYDNHHGRKKNTYVRDAAPAGEKGVSNYVDEAINGTEHGSAAGASYYRKSGQKQLCRFWVDNKCAYGDKCRFLHSWFSGAGFTLLKRLEKQQNSVTGIALPSGSDKLFSGSKDGSVCVWDCNTGQCATKVQVESEIGCMITEGPLMFAGLQNAVKAWNLKSNTDIVLPCPGAGGLVNALALNEGVLFAGMEDGSILAWKSSSESCNPEALASLEGHNSAVISLIVGAKRLYSGSKDHTIRVWDLKTLECIQILKGHSDSVTSLLCWDSFLFSGSSDKSLKVWGTAENGSLEVIHEMKQERGILGLRGICDSKGQPILLCSSEDNSVHMYDLPSFAERGRTYSKGALFTVEIGPGGLFFTGDSTGEICVWKLD